MKGARILGAALWVLIILGTVWWCSEARAQGKNQTLCYPPVAGSSSCQPVSPTTPYPMKPFGIPTVAAPSYGEGVPSPFSFDLNGNLRVSATITPSGTQDINLKQVQGAVPSLTNPIWVFPATGATFPVSGTFFQATQPVSGTFFQATQPVSIASGQVASGSFASGSMAAGSQVDLLTMRGTVAAGTAAANSILAGNVFNTTAPAPTNGQQIAQQADSTGALRINSEGRKATYSASGAVVLATTANDVFTLTGSASKMIRITRVQFAGVATSATAANILLVKRSTANSGGSTTAVTAVPYDSANAAATGTVLAYTANPTGGTLVGIMHTQLITFTTSVGAIPVIPNSFDFTTRNSQAVVLRNTSEVFAVGLGGVTVTGGSLTISIEWTEE